MICPYCGHEAHENDEGIDYSCDTCGRDFTYADTLSQCGPLATLRAEVRKTQRELEQTPEYQEFMQDYSPFKDEPDTPAFKANDAARSALSLAEKSLAKMSDAEAFLRRRAG